MTIDVSKIKTPPEEIRETDWFSTAVKHGNESLAERKRIVQLACSHFAIARNLTKMVCPRCTEMLRRSILTGEVDYVLFREGKVNDEMVWLEDPCRGRNETVKATDTVTKSDPMRPRF